jgi:hypothetical protein
VSLSLCREMFGPWSRVDAIFCWLDPENSGYEIGAFVRTSLY